MVPATLTVQPVRLAKERATTLALALLAPLAASPKVIAGPPYLTDDPEPVEYQHWEFYVASLFNKQSGVWFATGPHVEVNYGAVPSINSVQSH